MQVPEAYAQGTIRFSLGRGTSTVELDQVSGLLPALVAECRNSLDLKRERR